MYLSNFTLVCNPIRMKKVTQASNIIQVTVCPKIVKIAFFIIYR